MPAWHSDALIIDAVRSPIGRRNGMLSSIRGDELAGQVLNALVERQGLDPANVEDVQFGCVTQIGEQAWNIGRMVPLVAGWPETVCGTTVDRQCGSSMQANFNAATAVWSGQLDLVVVAGVEMMSRVPMGSGGGDLSDKLLDRWQIVPQGISAEVIADEWGLSRDDLDAFSLESHRRAVRAIDEALKTRLANDPLERPGLLWTRAGVYCRLGQPETALQQLEELAKVPNGATYGDLRFNPVWDPLRGNPRFEKIVESLKPK